MRKLYFTVIVLLMTAGAYAGSLDVVISSVNGQPITPTKEITILPTDVISFDIVYTAPPGWSVWTLILDLTVQGPGTLDISTITWPAGYWNLPYSMITAKPFGAVLDVVAADVGTVPAGIILDHFIYNCASEGDVVINLIEHPGQYEGGTFETDGSDLYILYNFGPGVVIHYIVPACWDCPWQPEGDANGDGEIDVVDYFLFRKAYGTGWNTHPHGTGVGQYNCCCDFNHDGKVDSADYFPIRINWKKVFAPCSNISCQ